MKVLIHSNGPHVPSGYGKQARIAGMILRELGHEVAFSCFSGLGGQPIRWDGYTLFPSGQLEFGVDVLPGHARAWGADVIMPIMDTWKLGPAAAELADMKTLIVPFMIIDCEAPNGGPGLPDQAVLKRLGPAVLPVAVSRFGQARLAAVGYEDAPFVPHAFGPEFSPMSKDERLALRIENRTDRDFVIGVCAANSDAMRKGWSEHFGAFARFARRHKDARLNIFSVYQRARGLDLVEMAGDMGIMDRCMFMPMYEQVSGMLGDEFMRAWYNSIDVLSMPSYGEGFGVPLIEAQACGTPVVTSDNSAMPELNGSGWLIKGQRFWNPVHRAWWSRPDEDSIVRGWETAYRGAAVGSARAETKAADYSYAVVRDNRWRPLVDIIEAAL